MSNHAENVSATTSGDYARECSVAGPSGEQKSVKKKEIGTGLENIFRNYASEESSSDDGAYDRREKRCDSEKKWTGDAESDDFAESCRNIGLGERGGRGHGTKIRMRGRPRERADEHRVRQRSSDSSEGRIVHSDSGTPRRRVGVASGETSIHREENSGTTSEKDRQSPAGATVPRVDTVCGPRFSPAPASDTGDAENDGRSDVLFNSCGSSAEGSNEDIPCVGASNEKIEKDRRIATLMWLEGYRDATSKRYLLHDIYTNGTGNAGKECALRLMAKLRTGTYCIASHGAHLHVLHTCDYNNSTCRCYITKVLRSRFGKWVARTCASTRNNSFERWRSLAVYLSHGTRVIIKVNHTGGDWIRGGENRALPVRGSGERGSPQLVEGGPHADKGTRSCSREEAGKIGVLRYFVGITHRHDLWINSSVNKEIDRVNREVAKSTRIIIGVVADY